MKELIPYTYILFISLFISCEKENEDFSNAFLVPSEIKEEYTTYGDTELIWVEKTSVYEYDTKGRFRTIKTDTYNNNKWGNTRNVSFSYDADGRLATKETQVVTDTLESFQVTTYLYAGNEVEIWINEKLSGLVIVEDDLETPLRYTTYSEGVRFTPEPETYRYVNECQYTYDDNGNILEKTYVYVGNNRISSISKDAYEYDSRNGFYKHVKMPLWYKIIEETLFLHNNPVKLYQKYIGGEFMLWRVFEYEYNKDGYPVQVVYKLSPEVYENSLATIYTISYISAPSRME